VNVTVLADGVSILSPLPNSTSGQQVVVSASARESTAGIYQLQVWDSSIGKKLGQSAPGSSTINQTFVLSSGMHQVIVEDIGMGTFSGDASIQRKRQGAVALRASPEVKGALQQHQRTFETATHELR
jgi:hypothetical protein